jgi:hypothetical protein
MNLNLSACSTHVLINKGSPTSNPSYFTGNSSTCQPAKPKDWVDMYSSMYYGRVSSAFWTMPSPNQLAINMYSTENSLHARLSQVNTEMGEVAKLPLLYADYNYIITNTDSTKPYYTQNNLQQLFDNPNRTVNPYGQDLLVNTTSMLTESTTGSVLFMVPSNLYLSNKTAITNLNLSADFNGTNSYVALSPDVPYLHKYSSTGLKTITLKIVHGSNTYYAKTNINIKAINYSTNILGKTLNYTSSDAVWHDRVSQTTGTDLSPALGHIVFGNTNTTTSSGPLKLRNPVIFIEGQDVLNEFHFTELYGLINGYATNPDGLINKLFNDGRDLIILDFGDMQSRNLRDLAETVRRLIKYVNQNLDPAVSNNKLTVAGHSMGGVLARYTLAKMEQTYCENHNVGLYISYDAPHKGANATLGFQELNAQSWAAGALFLSASSMGDYLRLIAPTTKELSNAYYSVNNYGPSPEHISFYNELDQMGMPQKCRTIGLALGNTFNNALDPTYDIGNAYNPGVSLLNFSQTGEETVIMIVRAPNNNTTQSICDFYIHVHKVIENSWWQVLMTFSSTTTLDFDWVNSTRPFLSPLPYDNAPGSYLDVPRQVANGINSSVINGNATTNDHPQVNIIPTTSALNIRNTNIFHISSTLAQIRSDKSHSFDEVYIMNNNYIYNHIGMYPDLSDNIYNEIVNTISSSPTNTAANSLVNIGNRTYNYGEKSYNQTINNIDIGNGGRLKFNANTGVNFDGSGATPVAGSTYQISTSSCGATVNINNGGKMIIGEASTNNIAIVNFKSGSVTKIKSGGELVIYNNSKLVVESGAKLIFETGGNINLSASNSTIEVKSGGQIILGPNATFNYTGAGFIKFETASGNAIPHIMANGTNARFMLNSGNFNNKTKKLLQVTGGQTANIDPSVYLFAVLNGNIALDANSRINVITKCQMQNVDIVASRPNSLADRHRGIVFNGYSENIYNVSVSDAITGITALNYYGGGDIYLSQFSATRCGTALQISGKGANVYSANINNCDLGVFLDKMDRQTYFYNPTITACKRGMYGSENNLNVIELDQPNIYNNIYGVDALKTIFTARCGKIYNNSSNIATNRSSFEGANVYLRANSNLYLDPNLRPSSGSMEMRNIRALSILQDKSAWLSPQLSGGRNNLWTPIDYSIYGTLTDKNIASGVNINKPSNLNLWNYVYTGSGWTSVAPVDQIDYNVKYTALGNMQSYKILYNDINPLAAFQSCYSAGSASGGTSTGGGGGGTNDRFTGNIPAVITPIADLPISNPTPKGEVIHDKITIAYNYYFSEGANYYEAVNAFTHALQTKFIQSDLDNWTDAIHIVNAQMAEALSMGLADGSIERYDASGASYSQSISDVLDVQDKLLIDFAEDALSKYKINNMKAYIYRMISERETCIALLHSISSDVPSDFTDIHNRAICQITNELNYINGAISLDDLESAACTDPSGIDPSWQPFIGEELSDEFVIKNNDSTGVNNASNQPIKLYPNPSNTGITTLHFYAESGMHYEISLFDLLGRKVLQLNGIAEKENNINLNISELPAGSYIVKLNSSKITQTKNLIITK